MFIVQLKFASVKNSRLVLHDCEYAKLQRACQRSKEKNDKVSRCWSAYQEKRLGEIRLSDMRIGDMRIGEMRRQRRQVSSHLRHVRPWKRKSNNSGVVAGEGLARKR